MDAREREAKRTVAIQRTIDLTYDFLPSGMYIDIDLETGSFTLSPMTPLPLRLRKQEAWRGSEVLMKASPT